MTPSRSIYIQINIEIVNNFEIIAKKLQCFFETLSKSISYNIKTNGHMSIVKFFIIYFLQIHMFKSKVEVFTCK